jgi:hypothetical protein
MAQNWIIDNQLNRRNISPEQRTYLIGKRYKEEKKEPIRPKFDNKVATVTNLQATNGHTEQKIAEQSNVSPKTVRNAEKFADAVDKVSEEKDGLQRGARSSYYYVPFVGMSCF